jgi:hypothetical protein
MDGSDRTVAVSYWHGSLRGRRPLVTVAFFIGVLLGINLTRALGGERVTLDTLANIAEIAGGIMIVGGAIFAMVQLRELKQQRRNAIASELMQTFNSTDLSRAVALIHTIPDNVSAADLRSRGEHYEQAAILICTHFETMGLLVYQRIAPYDLVEQLAGGMMTTMYRKLHDWLETLREEQNQSSWAEWFQWVAQQMANSKTESAPAHEKYRNWRP